MPRRTGTGVKPRKKRPKRPKRPQDQARKRKPKPKPHGKAPQKPGPGAAPAASSRGAVPFPRPGQPPSEAEFLARIPVAAGRKLEALRSFLGKQRGVSESLFFFGPRTGWAYRYLRGEQSVATLMLHAGQLMGIVALDGQALSTIDFAALSPVAAAARKAAHGSPSLSWLDLPVDGTGAGDFKVLVKAKLRTLPPPPNAEGAAGPGRTTGSTRRRHPPPPPPPPPASPAPPSPPGSVDGEGAGRLEAARAPRPPRGANRV